MRGVVRPYVWLTGALLAVVIFAFIVGHAVLSSRTASLSLDLEPLLALPGSPLDATFRFGEREVTLRDGNATYGEDENEYVVRLVGTPALGDLTGTGADDAAFVLSREGEGRIDHFVVVAIRDGDGYLGSNAVPFDWTEGATLSVRDELVIVVRGGEAIPTLYFTTTGARVYEITPESGQKVFAGLFTYTNTVRVFTTCTGERFTISDDIRAQAILEAVYQGRSRVEGDTVYVVLSGEVMESDENGSAVLDVSHVMSAPSHSACPSVEL
jgi:hypothetical protein